MMRAALAGLGLAVAAGGAALALQNQAADPVSTAAPPAADAPDNAAEAATGGSPRAGSGPAYVRAETPMAQRVAVLGLLNKRNGIARDLTLRPGQAVRVGDVIVRLRACETTAPQEVQKLTGAFVQLDVRGTDAAWRRVFSGWLYAESPSLNVVEHPVYDVWPKSCAMTHPEIGAATVRAAASAGSAPASRSSAPNDPAAPAPSAAAPAPAASAEPSNAM